MFIVFFVTRDNTAFRFFSRGLQIVSPHFLSIHILMLPWPWALFGLRFRIIFSILSVVKLKQTQPITDSCSKGLKLYQKQTPAETPSLLFIVKLPCLWESVRFYWKQAPSQTLLLTFRRSEGLPKTGFIITLN